MTNGITEEDDVPWDRFIICTTSYSCQLVKVQGDKNYFYMSLFSLT